MGDGAAARTPRAPSFAAQVARVAGKDLRIEWKSREILSTMGFLAVLVVLIFAMAFEVGDVKPGPAVISGILWLALVFSGTVALGKTFERERDGEALRALLLSPAPRGAIFLGKLLAAIALMLSVEVIVFGLVAILVSDRVAAHAAWLALLVGLGTLGFAAVGTVFSAALMRSRSRDALLSALLYPVVIPVVLAGTRGSAQLLDAVSDVAGARLWTQFLVVVDLLYVLIGLWAFEPVVSGE